MDLEQEHFEVVDKLGIKVMIVDDHYMFLEGISSLLNDFDEISIVETASDGVDALAKLSVKNEIDVLITDLSMPEINGFELCNAISKKYPHINILTLSMHSDGNSINKAIKSGAKGYVLKNTDHEELIKAITALANGKTYYSDQVKNNLMDKLGGRESEDLYDEIKLTKREIEVLTLIALEYTTQMIAHKLFISFHTVESHRKNLMRKLKINNLAGLIKYAIKKGLVD